MAREAPPAVLKFFLRVLLFVAIGIVLGAYWGRGSDLGWAVGGMIGLAVGAFTRL